MRIEDYGSRMWHSHLSLSWFNSEEQCLLEFQLNVCVFVRGIVCVCEESSDLKGFLRIYKLEDGIF